MANYKEFDKIRKKLDGRHFICKMFYDFYMNKIDIGTSEVYLKKDVEDILHQLKIKYGEQNDELKFLKIKNESLRILNFKLEKKNGKRERNNS